MTGDVCLLITWFRKDLDQLRFMLSRRWTSLNPARVRTRSQLHDLRHSFASTGVADNLSLVIIGTLLGHRNTATTQRYAHLSAHPLRAANEAVGSKIAAALNAGKQNKALYRRCH
jgi:site-specific recombinase XerD